MLIPRFSYAQDWTIIRALLRDLDRLRNSRRGRRRASERAMEAAAVIEALKMMAEQMEPKNEHDAALLELLRKGEV